MVYLICACYTLTFFVLKVDEVIVKFYKNKDINANYDLSPYFSSDVLALLNDKINTAQYVDELYNFKRQNYTVTVQLIENEVSGPTMRMGFAVETKCSYSDDKDDISTIGEYVIILYDIDTNKIVDFYTPENYYDEAVRPENDETDVLTSNGYKASSNIEEKQVSLINDINGVYNQQSESFSIN